MTKTNKKPKTIKRGDIFFIHKGVHKPQGAEMYPGRPAVVVTSDTNNKYNQVIGVAYITTSTKKKPGPTHVPIQSKNKPGIVLCEQIHSVDKARVGDFISHVGHYDMKQIDAALKKALEL